MKEIASLFSNYKLRDFLAHIFSQTNEPKIISHRSNRGHVYFKVYDPQTKCSGTFNSEREVRIWLDERYYSKF